MGVLEATTPEEARATTPRGSAAVALGRTAAALLGWGLLAGTVASLAAVADGGQGGDPVVLLAALAAWLMPVTVAALLLFAAARLWRSALVALVVLLVVLGWLQPFPHGSADPRGTTVSLTVMSQNVLFGGADPQALVRRVREARPDVLVLTELTPAGVARFDAAGLAAVLPHRYLDPANGASGTGIYAARPLRDTRPIGGTTFNALEARIEVSGHQVTVAAVHPVPPQISSWAADYVTMAALLEPRVRAGESLVVAGDFNATQYHAPFRRLLDAGFTDAGQARLWAWQQQTWPVGGIGDGPVARRVPPLIRIDHVLVPRRAGVESLTSPHLAGSDHAGVLARVRLPVD